MRSRFSRRTILAFSLVGVLLNSRFALTTDGPIDIVVSAHDTAGSDSHPPDEARANSTAADLRIGLFVNREVSRTTIDTMRTEAERIWMPYAVQLKWLPTGADVDVIALVGLGSRLCSSSGSWMLSARPAARRITACRHHFAAAGEPGDPRLGGQGPNARSDRLARIANGNAARSGVGS